MTGNMHQFVYRNSVSSIVSLFFLILYNSFTTLTKKRTPYTGTNVREALRKPIASITNPDTVHGANKVVKVE
jgi:hypothetical protein